MTLKKKGANWMACCPFHQEKTPSFSVNPSKSIFYCFGCGVGGSVFNFVMQMESVSFPEAVRTVAEKAGVPLPQLVDDKKFEARRKEADEVIELNAWALEFWERQLAEGGAEGRAAREYVEGRGITDETRRVFRLGYAPNSWDALGLYLKTKGASIGQIERSGLVVKKEAGGYYDRFRGRLIFPIRDAKGRNVGFGGRVLGAGEPKYLNSPATPVFDKSRVLYTIEYAADAIRSAREAVVVEGYVDALRAHQEGFSNVVATLGTAVTEHQLRALARLAPRLVLALDADPAGQKAASRAGLAALSALSVGDARASQPLAPATGMRRDAVQVYVAALPAGQDPDDAIAADPAAWRRAIADAVPLMDHYFTLVEVGLDRTRPEWRQEAIDTLVPAIGQLGGVGVQQAYIERLAALTGIDARYLRDLTPAGCPRGAGDLYAAHARASAPLCGVGQRQGAAAGRGGPGRAPGG